MYFQHTKKNVEEEEEVPLTCCFSLDFFFAQELKKFNLLMEISLAVVEQLFIALIIPCIRPNAFPVVIHILRSAQSLAVFEKLMHRIPKVIPAIESNIRAMSTDEELIFQQLIDIIFALMRKFPVADDSYREIVS